MVKQGAKRCRFSLAFIVILLFVRAIDAQSVHEHHAQIRAAMQQRDLAAATATLHSLRRAEPSIFGLNNYDYLLARLSEQRGDIATAAAGYQSVVARNSLLTQYALWHLAGFARSTGNLTLERDYLRQLIAVVPASLLRDAAIARMGASFFASGDYASAISTLRPRSLANRGTSAREALSLIGQAYLRSGQKASAREVFNTLITQLPDPARPDDFALAGVRGLDYLDTGKDESAQTSAPQLAESEHLRRALIYNFNRDFAGARRHYLVIVQRYAQSPRVPDALYQIGRGFYQERHHEEALLYLRRCFTQYSEHPIAPDALSLNGATLSRLQRTDEAIAAYRLLIDRYPDASNPERPFLNIIDALREAGRDQEALNWVQQTRTRFKDQGPSTLALFSQARIRLAQGAWALAHADLDALSQEPNLRGASQSEVPFLRAYTLEQMNRMEEAINAYLSIPDGRNEYYGRRATQRFKALIADSRAAPVISPLRDKLIADAQQSLAAGQWELARRSAQSALRLTEDPPTAGKL